MRTKGRRSSAHGATTSSTRWRARRTLSSSRVSRPREVWWGSWPRGACKVSPKSVILTNPPRLGKRLAQQLPSQGIHLQAPRAAKDLGVDAHGARRSTAVLQTRLRKASTKLLRYGATRPKDSRLRRFAVTGRRLRG